MEKPVGKGQPVTDPAHDVLRPDVHPLDPIFKPQSVALIGASERPGSVGRNVLWNLLSSPFGGTLYPVNPKRSNILGIRTYPSLTDLPEVVDLVVITTPAESVPALIKEAVGLGIPAAIVISAGFKEVGEAGKKLEAEIMDTIRGKMRLIGPNCLGVMNPVMGLNATFATTIARPGNVAFISQSGALCTAVLDWSLKENVGFSSFVSIGSMLDVNWGDLIDYFGNDPRTNSIVIYMESIGDARSFLSAAREVSLTKPIIVIKAGRTAAAAKAAASHTGSLTGSDDVLEAAFRRTGVLRVNSIGDIFYVTDVLAKQPRPKGNRLCIITNAGGPGVLSTDALIGGGGELAELSPETIEAFNADSAVRLEPQQPGGYSRRCGAGTLRKGTGNRSQGPQHRWHADRADPAGHDQSDADCRTACGRSPRAWASRCWPVGWAETMFRPAWRFSTRRAFRPSRSPTPRPAPSTTCGSIRTTSRASTKLRSWARPTTVRTARRRLKSSTRFASPDARS